jgi:acyl carrier protein
MLDRNNIRQTVVEIMEADTGESYADLEDSKQLRTELGLDSVDVVSIVSSVERRYRIRLSQQELEKLVTFGDVLDLLESKLHEVEAKPKAA